ncbi:MAG: amidohydrolase family protein, partial [Pseudomonadota bacterium]
MRQIWLSLSALALAACGDGVETTSEIAVPEQAVEVKVFTGGTIYAGLGDNTVEAVAVGSDGRILAVGASALQDWDESEVTLIDLSGGVMFPGFTDGHAHLIGIGERELTLDLAGTGSVADLVARIEAEVARMPAGRVVLGRGWIETGWPEGRMPVASDLDAISPDNPVILVRADGHALVANSAALSAAGVSDDTVDVAGGKIERDASGTATGIIIDNSMAQLLALVAEPSESQIAERYVVGAVEYASRGWTGIHNMSVAAKDARLLERLDVEGRMPLRLHNAFDRDGLELAMARAHETDTITNRAVKVYMDGALGSRGALLIEPYSDRPATRGLSLMEPEVLDALMAEADQRDVQLAVHAIGDLANRRILDVFE